MRAKDEHRDRDDDEVTVLDALANRGDDGMTVFEVRAHTDLDIDAIESALTALKRDDLIEVNAEDGRTVLVPDDSVITAEQPDEEESFIDSLKRQFPF